RIIEAMKNDTFDANVRKTLAAKAFQHTAHYDGMIATYFNNQLEESFPSSYASTYEKVQDLRYGENPHQQAAFYKDPFAPETSIANSIQLHGKELSYNNIQDTNAALEIALEYTEPTVVAVKHMNPCGIGSASTISQAFTKAHQADETSIFGGIVACNREVERETAEQMTTIFLEVIIAPSFTNETKIDKKSNKVEIVSCRIKRDQETAEIKTAIYIQVIITNSIKEEAKVILTKKEKVRLLTVPFDQPEETINRTVSVLGGLLV